MADRGVGLMDGKAAEVPVAERGRAAGREVGVKAVGVEDLAVGEVEVRVERAGKVEVAEDLAEAAGKVVDREVEEVSVVG